MYKWIKNGFIVIVLLILVFSFTPSYTSLTIDNLAYVVAIGIDKGEKETYKITFQFTTGTSQQSSEQNPSFINSVEASSIDTAINLMNAYISKELNLSHCKVIVFSEELAAEGLSNLIYTFINHVQLRPSTNIIISKTTSLSYIENTKPTLESLITKYYDVFPNSNKYTGYVSNVTIGDFFNALVCKTCEPSAILGGVSTGKVDTTIQGGNDFYVRSMETNFVGEQGSENLGLAVFKGDKLVGELNAIETLCLSLVRNQVDSFLLSVVNPDNEEEKIDISINNQNFSSKVEIINGTPFITVTGKLKGFISSMAEQDNYADSTTLKRISESVNFHLENLLTQYLYKTSTVFHSDINGFGKYAASLFLTLPEFEDYNWLDNYQYATFQVKMEAEIQTGTMITTS